MAYNYTEYRLDTISVFFEKVKETLRQVDDFWLDKIDKYAKSKIKTC